MIKKTLYFGSPVALSVVHSQLHILRKDRPGSDLPAIDETRPIEDIGILIIDNPQITITSQVLTEVMEAGAAILSCDRSHMPAGLMLHLENNTMQSERFRTQIGASLPLRKQLWKQTVSAKIYNQSKALEVLTGERHGNMLKWCDIVKSGDSDNLEGRAAAYYWRTLLKDCPDTRRNPEGDEPNCMLNYGYAILRAIVARALVASGLHPTIGLFHKNKYNAFCLADDIMEPYRPYVDIKVMKILSENPEATMKSKDVKRELLSIPTEDVVIDGKRRPLMIGVSETTASLYKCFAGEINNIKYPKIDSQHYNTQ